jgi:crotonobetainyl-CoA:carnitine CoA-transferase CaiB-like acyl-CoA transferase
MEPLANIRIVTMAGRLPGPVAVAHLCRLGASAIKVEPPEGDPLQHACPEWYRQLYENVAVQTLNLKEPTDRARLEELLAAADLFLTATRPAALERLGLSWSQLHARHPRLSQIAIAGHAPPDEDRAGHDLTYQARLGLLDPPHLPRVLVADWAGGHAAVSTALALILARERGQGCQFAEVRLADAASDFAEPLRHGLTASGGLLGGAFAGYNLYRARDGWIAVAALEPHFWQRLARAASHASPSAEHLARFFQARTAKEWEAWGRQLDVPIVAVQDVPVAED